MKQIDLFHPRVFHDQDWADGYYKRNRKSIEKVGQRIARLLQSMGFATVPIEIAKAFPKVTITGIDLGEPLLEIGRKLIKNNGLENQIVLLNGDAQNLQYDDCSFDVVINSFLIHIVEDPILMLNEIERVAKPEGIILITDLRRGFLAFVVKKFRTAHTSEEASDLLEKSKIRHDRFASGPFWWDYIIDNTTR